MQVNERLPLFTQLTELAECFNKLPPNLNDVTIGVYFLLMSESRVALGPVRGALYLFQKPLTVTVSCNLVALPAPGHVGPLPDAICEPTRQKTEH